MVLSPEDLYGSPAAALGSEIRKKENQAVRKRSGLAKRFLEQMTIIAQKYLQRGV